jgi:hypothetical protein
MSISSKPVSFADYTSIMFHRKSDHFQNCINETFANLKKWFKVNQLALYSDITHLMEFATSNNIWTNLKTSNYDKKMEAIVISKFLSLQNDINSTVDVTH